MAKGKWRRAVGLIMDAAEMRAVEISGSPQRFKVTASGSEALKPGMLTDGILTDVPAVSEIFSRLLKKNRFSLKTPVVIGAKNQNVLLRMASFPTIPEDKMRNAVLYQAQQFIPIPVSELTLDYVECGTGEEAGHPVVNVLLVGAKKIFLDSALELCDKAGRIVADIDSAALATMRAVSAEHQEDGLPYMLADVDHETTGMMACRGETVLMARTVPHPISFNDLIQGRHEEASLDEDALAGVAAYLSDDIRASMQYFSAQDRTPMSRVYLIGRFPQLDEIARVIGESLNVPVVLPRMYPSVTGVDTVRYGTCISLALRGLEV